MNEYIIDDNIAICMRYENKIRLDKREVNLISASAINAIMTKRMKDKKISRLEASELVKREFRKKYEEWKNRGAEES